MPGKCSFQEKWLKHEEYKGWLLKYATDEHRARCAFCCSDLFLGNMGEAMLKQHLKTKKHKKQARQHREETQATLGDFFTVGTSRRDASAAASNTASGTSQQDANPPNSACSTSTASTSATTSSSSSSTSRLQGFNLDNKRLEAEILWALKVAQSHYSYKSSENSAELFRRMFSDSEIAANFKCGETKCRYLTTFGLAPRFLDMLKDSVKSSSDAGYVIIFDESLNKKTHSKQMDFMIRVWEEGQVKTRYLTSEFLGHARADDLKTEFEDVFARFNLLKPGLLQVGMDGPNVNWSMYNILDCDLLDNHGVSLLHTGSCGLHTVHNAFRKGYEATSWNIDHFLTSAYKLFEYSPARLEDYQSVVNSSMLPLKFCTHRWLENALPASRAIEILPSLELYVQAAVDKKVTLPKTTSFDDVKEVVNNPLLPCRLSFFASVARSFEPFLTKYQADKPLLPFLAEDLFLLLKRLMTLFIKEDVLSACTSPSKLIEVDVKDMGNHRKTTELDFRTQSLLNKARKHPAVTDRIIKEFKNQCRSFLMESVSALCEKCPLKYTIVRSMTCLDPRKMHDKDQCRKDMKKLLHCIINSKRISEETADTVLQQYSQFLGSTAIISSASGFDCSTVRVDQWWSDAIAGKVEYKHLWLVVKKLLLLSHGQLVS